jgi:heptosyltransferase-1
MAAQAAAAPPQVVCENLSLHTQTQFRLLVVRLGAMGDILHALPAVTALRQAHPAWRIGWVVEPRWRALLSASDGSARGPLQPVVDRLHFAQVRDWKQAPLSRQTFSSVRALRRELRDCRYDVVIDMQGSIRSAVIARLAGCRRVIGEASPRERAACLLFNERVSTTGAHVIEQDVELASAIAGDELAPAEPILPADPAAESWADAFLTADPVPAGSPRTGPGPWGGQPIALLNPGAGWGAKRWPVERYAAVAQGLIQRGFRVLINTGPGELPLAEAISQATAGAAQPLTASLQQLIAVTRRVSLCIAGDTGPLHLACALRKPVVGIYGPTDPSRNGPFATRFRVLRHPASKRDHSRRAQPEAGLLTIQPADVLAAADELLAEAV